MSYTNGSHVWPSVTFYYSVKNPDYVEKKNDDRQKTNYRSNKRGGSGGYGKPTVRHGNKN